MHALYHRVTYSQITADTEGQQLIRSRQYHAIICTECTLVQTCEHDLFCTEIITRRKLENGNSPKDVLWLNKYIYLLISDDFSWFI